MASPSELSLDCKPSSYSMLLKSFGDNFKTDQMQKLEDFVSRLEEERLKIDAFKRELPLCMQLLTNAVEVYGQQLQAYRANNSNNDQQGAKPVLEEFIPLRNANAENAETTDKANWMTTAQLWSQAVTADKVNAAETKPNVSSLKENTDIALDTAGPKLGLDAKQRNGGAFLPFSKEQRTASLPELALSNSTNNNSNNNNNNNNNKEIEDINRVSENGNGLAIEQPKGQNGNFTDGHTAIHDNNNNNNSAGGNSVSPTVAASTTTTQTHRKPRRCWSPDLHRRFVNALQMLGGSQVATPKQIRELMKVEGLTNDEVKSHLQKYRLHTRRPSPSPQTAGGPTPQLVVLGGIWVPPEYATAAAAAHGGTSALYHHHHTTATATHHPPPHFCSPPVPQEFYSSATTPPPLPPPLHNPHHHQFHPYKITSALSEPTNPREGGDADGLTDSGEEGKSESSSWKAAESGGERKGLAALKEEGEESNGSEITLKF